MYNLDKNKAESKMGEHEYIEDKIKNNELFKKYIHYIRNINVLDNEMINNIRSMSNEEKMAIIITFNIVIENIKELL
jgi:hypothetical protein